MPNQELRVPVFCPVCGGLMKGKSTNTYYDFNCCIDCYIFFLEGRPEAIRKWREGQRPTEEALQRYREFMKD